MRKVDVVTCEDIDKYFSKVRKIRFTNEDLVKDNTSDLAIFKLLINSKYSTCYVKGGYHCPSNKYRSLYDFCRLIKFYRPSITFKDILNTLYEYYTTQTYSKILSYCPDIRKYNFRIGWPTDNKLTSSVTSSIIRAMTDDYRSLSRTEVAKLVESTSKEYVIVDKE